ncbi:MAG: BMC domain-containing protein, partial [Myxococcales bacterium]|nr:BMC domain-containing protein [Myxococcales bacterium]
MGRADDAPEALSLIEFDSIALGTKAVDALLKKAPVRMERLGTLQPGKLATLFSGDVASVEASHGEALRVAGTATIDEILLPQVEPRIYAAIFGEVPAFEGDTLGMVETSTMAAAVLAADVMVKG